MSFNHPEAATGAQAIAEKLRTLTFQTISHSISTMDIQPTYDNCIMIVVTGVLKVGRKIINRQLWFSFSSQADNDPPMQFTETFQLRFINNAWLVVNNVFRLILAG